MSICRFLFPVQYRKSDRLQSGAMNRPTRARKPQRPWRERLHEIIFEADTPAGKLFDVALLILIVISVLAVTLETVPEVRVRYGSLLRLVEWVLTVLFTIEYVLRLSVVKRPLRYATSFYGIVDLFSILPTYLSIFFAGSQSLLVIRALRLLRVFRILKLAHFVVEARQLGAAVYASTRKIIIFLGVVSTLVVIIGASMYLIEGEAGGFTSIPLAIYWAIVTLTTVGYGDIAPTTVLGKMFASIVMILGYAIIAVPTGIVTVELTNVHRKTRNTRACPACGLEGHDFDARHCKACGAELD